MKGERKFLNLAIVQNWVLLKLGEAADYGCWLPGPDMVLMSL